MKLGLKICKTSDGFQQVLEINGNPEWTKYVEDIRSSFQSLGNFYSKESASLIAYRSIESGRFYIFSSPLPGRDGDMINAWLYIPWEIQIAGKTLANFIEEIGAAISGFSIQEALLTKHMSKDWPTSKFQNVPVLTKGNSAAVWFYGSKEDATLQTILEKGLLQPAIGEYSTVLLISRDSDISYEGNNDLSALKIMEMVTVNPAAADKWELYYNDSLFNEPIILPKDTKIRIEWRRDKFKTIQKEYIVQEGTKIETPQSSEIIYLLPYSSIIVKNEQGIKLEGYSIRVNGKKISEYENIELSQISKYKIHLEVSMDKYQTYSEDLIVAKDKITIVLKKSRVLNTFKIPLTDGRFWDFTLESYEQMTASPIKGYEISDKDEHNDIKYLKYQKPSARLSLLNMIICCAISFSLGVWVSPLLDNDNVVENTSTGVDNPVNPATNNNLNNTPPNNNMSSKDENDDLEKALTYLANKKWEKVSMDAASPMLIGVWDDLNNLRFSNILSHETDFFESDNYCKLCAAIKNLQKRGGNASHVSARGHFCSEGDTTITIQIYIDKINNCCIPSSSDAKKEKKDKKSDSHAVEEEANSEFN